VETEKTIETEYQISKKRKTTSEEFALDNIIKMEEKLKELNEKEEGLKREARRLLEAKRKTCQSIARKRNRIRELEGLIQTLKEAPTIEEDSDGDEQLIGIIRSVNQLPKETEYIAEKHIVIDENTGMSMTINSSTAISSNIPLELRDEKIVTVTQNIRRNTITKVIQADWATKVIRCDMSRDNREIPGSRQVLKPGIIETAVREPDTPSTTVHPDETNVNQQPTIETIRTGASEQASDSETK